MDWFAGLSQTEKFRIVARHFAHVLAFNSLLFSHFNKPDGSLYTIKEYLKVDNFANNILNYYLAFPSVVKFGRDAFNCSTLPGVRINDPGEKMLYWSSRMMLNDFMADTATDTPGYSEVTFGVFYDSGWYEVQWKYTNPVQFGRGRGCSIFQQPCIAGGQLAFPEFCVSGSNICGPLLTNSGACSITNYQYGIPSAYSYLGTRGGRAEMDYCPIVETGQSCLEGTASGSDEKCPECRCVAGNYRPIGESDSGVALHCQRVSCRDNKAFVQVGSEEVECAVAGDQCLFLDMMALSLARLCSRFALPLRARTSAAATELARTGCASAKAGILEPIAPLPATPHAIVARGLQQLNAQDADMGRRWKQGSVYATPGCQ